MRNYEYIEELCKAVIGLHELYEHSARKEELLRESEYVEGIPVKTEKEERVRKLEETVRDRFEYMLKCEIPEVSIHMGGAIEEELRGGGADALTKGRDIYIREEKYQEGSEETERILAHELTHVVQREGRRRIETEEEIAEAEEEASENERVVKYESDANYYVRINGKLFYLNKRIEREGKAYAVRELNRILREYAETDDIEKLEKFRAYVEKKR